MAKSVTVKLKNPTTIFYSSNGQTVRGERVVRFKGTATDPIPADVQQRIMSGFLVETDEEPSPEPEPVVPTVATPFTGALGSLVQPQQDAQANAALQAQVEELHKELAKLQAKVDGLGGTASPGEPTLHPEHEALVAKVGEIEGKVASQSLAPEIAELPARLAELQGKVEALEKTKGK